MNYKTHIQEEIYLCVKHIGFSYQDVMSMTVYERRNYLNLFLEEGRKREEQIENEVQNIKGGKGVRSSRISGDQLKAKLKSGEIPFSET